MSKKCRTKEKVLEQIKKYNALATEIRQDTAVKIVTSYERYSMKQRITIALIIFVLVWIVVGMFHLLGDLPFLAKLFVSLYVGFIFGVVFYSIFIFDPKDGSYLPLSDSKALEVLENEIAKLEDISAKVAEGRKRLSPWLEKMTDLAEFVEVEGLGHWGPYEDVYHHSGYTYCVAVKFSGEKQVRHFTAGEQGYKELELAAAKCWHRKRYGDSDIKDSTAIARFRAESGIEMATRGEIRGIVP